MLFESFIIIPRGYDDTQYSNASFNATCKLLFPEVMMIHSLVIIGRKSLLFPEVMMIYIEGDKPTLLQRLLFPEVMMMHS